MSLIDTYNQMIVESEAAEVEKQAEAELNEQEELVAKYASWAVEQYEAEGVQYTEEDVEKLATAKMEEDAYDLYMREKVAEAYEMGQVMYAGFKAAAEADNINE